MSGNDLGARAAQVVEPVWQMEGRCGPRQVPAARLALARNVGGCVASDVACACIYVLHGWPRLQIFKILLKILDLLALID